MSYWRSLSLLSSTLVSPSASRFAFLGLGVVQQPAFGAILGSRFKHSFKTSRSAYKRFRVRGNGSLKRNRAGTSHNTGHKSKTRNTALSQSTGIREGKIEKRMRFLIGSKSK